MTTFKTNTAKIERVDYLLSECVRLGEAMQAIADMADNVDVDDWTDADWKAHEALSKAISLGVDSEESFKHFKRIRFGK
tara:strand:+ start:429 stop:665 length:237 start_codon:yes stop_codon:yes gene_type:complete